jgi:O-antigen/teichoic acid export membrane protein
MVPRRRRTTNVRRLRSRARDPVVRALSSRSDYSAAATTTSNRSKRESEVNTLTPPELDSPGRTDSALVALARGTGLTLVGGVASVALGFALTLVVTRGLGAGGAGVFYVASGIFAILATLSMLGADIGCVRMVARYWAFGRVRELRTIIAVAVAPVFVLSTLVALAGVLLSGRAGDVFDTGDVTSALRVLLPVLPFAVVFAVVIGATRGLGTMVPHFATEQLGKPLARLVGVGAFVALGAGVTGALFAVSVTVVLATIISVIWLVRLLRRTEKGPARSAPASRYAIAVEFWRFAFVRGLVSVPKVLVEWLDVILVGLLTSTAEAGVYAAVTRLIRVGSLGQRATILAMSPRISALFAVGDLAQVRTLYRISTAWIVACSFPAYLVLAFFSPTVVQILGDDFSQGAAVLTILSLAMLVDVAAGPVTTILLMAGKASWVLGNAIASLVINVSLNILLIPTFGITGAAIAWAASILFQNLAPALQIAYTFRLHPFSVGLAVAAGGAIAAYGTAGLVHLVWSGGTAAIVLVTLATAVYGGVVWYNREVLSLAAIQEAVRFRAHKTPTLAGAP